MSSVGGSFAQENPNKCAGGYSAQNPERGTRITQMSWFSTIYSRTSENPLRPKLRRDYANLLRAYEYQYQAAIRSPERGASQSRRQARRSLAPGPTSMPTCPASRDTDALSELRARAVVASVLEAGTT